MAAAVRTAYAAAHFIEMPNADEHLEPCADLARPARGRAFVISCAAVLLVWLLSNLFLLWIYYEPALKPLIGDEFDYNRRALALLAGEPVAESFIWPPGQTWFIAAIYALFGSHVLGVQLVQIALFAGCAGLLVHLWRSLDAPRAAWFAGALFLLNPANLAYAHWLWPEVTHLVCLLGALALLLSKWRFALARAFGAGLLIGTALLFKSLLGAFWPLLLLTFLSRPDQRWRFNGRGAALFVGGLLLVTAPALWKGYVETGRPMIADSSIYNLHVGLIDISRSDYIGEAGGPALKAFLDSAKTPQERNAIYTDKIKDLVAQRGVTDVLADQFGTQYFRLFNAKTLLVSQLPGPACAGRLGAYAVPSQAPIIAGITYVAHALTLILAAFGIVLWRRWERPLALIVGGFLLYQLALYSGLHIMQRYLFQMMPFLCGFAGSALAAFSTRKDRSSDVLSFTPIRIGVAISLAALLLGLAFLGPTLDGNCQ